MASLFNRFGKLQRTAKLNNEGIGLGLTIVQQIVESANGTVKVESPGVGQGSTFKFSMQMDRTEEISDGGVMGLGLTHEPDDQSCLHSEHSFAILNENSKSPCKEQTLLKAKEQQHAKEDSEPRNEFADKVLNQQSSQGLLTFRNSGLEPHQSVFDPIQDELSQQCMSVHNPSDSGIRKSLADSVELVDLRESKEKVVPKGVDTTDSPT